MFYSAKITVDGEGHQSWRGGTLARRPRPAPSCGGHVVSATKKSGTALSKSRASRTDGPDGRSLAVA